MSQMSETQDTGKKILEKYDRDSAFRTLIGWRGMIISALLICFSLFQLYSTWFIVPSTHMRPIHMAIVTFVAFLLYPARKNMRKDTLPWYDIVLAVLSLAVYLYPAVCFEQIATQFGYTDFQIAVGLLGILLLLEACRRVVGIPIIIVALCFTAVGLFGSWMPGFLANRGFTLEQIVKHLFYTQEGIFGTPVGASSTFIFLFMLFGAFLEKTGVGEFFIELANAICGHTRGGPAKVAILTSALQGTVSGSSVANTVSTGSFTIPMMKRLGYKPEFAGAVEAAASTGGQIMPPVMGAAAFLMAESLGISYGVIIKAAIIPALLYFAGIYIIVDLEAKKQGLKGLDREQKPKVKEVLKCGYLILPLFVIIVLLAMGYTASVAALVAIATAILGSYVDTAINVAQYLCNGKERKVSSLKEVICRSNGLKLKECLGALEGGARSIISVALACGVAGIIAGMITKTGIGLKMGAGLTGISNGNLLILMMLTMCASILLGMGVPTTPNYLITSTIMAPIIYKALVAAFPDVYGPLAALGEGYALLPAHMFTFYFGIVADITPPVALAAMAGAAVAHADPIKTGVNASKNAIAAFLIPYIFVLNPQMLMLNATWLEVVQIIVSALIGMLGIGMCVEKYWNRRLSVIEQIIALVGGLLLVTPGLATDLVGVGLVVCVIIFQRMKKNRVV